ncbi:hypothetical protein NDU88_003539 [Pleurodeles waltl]|uniref:Uncharacterized protein n=1 Tax=Pleurodeles waltl TaxID=8319 RepID=A0AAV7T5W0_PLEWA|nr:hypothetical protein NDU88_003539 [Pleurodeles waltl]
MMARLLHFCDRDTLLQKERTNGLYAVDNRKVSLFPNYTAAVQSKRASYVEVKKGLGEEGLQYSLTFPSKLKVMLDVKTHFCEDRQTVWSWFDSYKSGSLPADSRCKGEQNKLRPRKRPHRARNKSLPQRPTGEEVKWEREEVKRKREEALQAATELAT